jgi:hypothetical protein
LYNYEEEKYFDSAHSNRLLEEAGLSVYQNDSPPILTCYEELEALANQTSRFANNIREWLYPKVSDGRWVTDRFKMVRQGFQQGCLLRDEIKCNRLRG